VLVKQVPAGHAVGYGRTFTTQRPSTLGIVPIGYNDGYLRAFSNRAVMSLAAGEAPVVGAISMDQTILDLTDLMSHDPPPKVGDDVVIIDNRRERPNSVESLARLLGTIPYEITCLLGNRVARLPVDSRS
jgi:alanine racemase